MADIFREVEEDLRRDNLNQLWKKYGGFLVALAVLIVVAVAAFVGWREWRASRDIEYSAQLVAAGDVADAGNLEEALAAYGRLAEEAGGGHELLARLRQAALAGALGRDDEALSAYESVAGSGADAVYRELAVLLGVMREIDRGNPDDLLERLTPLIREDGAWRYSARELTALLEHRRGNAERAADLLAALEQEPEAPPALRERAREALAAMGAANEG